MLGLFCLEDKIRKTVLDQYLIQRLNQPLPGRAVQDQMAHAIRQKMDIIPENVMMSAIMVLIYKDSESNWRTVLIKRAVHENDRHAGQISFPGGKKDESDSTLRETALRELFEEIGVPGEDIQVLGKLTELFIPVSNFMVQPFVGHLPYQPIYVPDESEVSEVIDLRIDHFLGNSAKQFTDIKVNPHITLKRVPFYGFNNHVIWGATAMILGEFVALLEGFNPNNA